MQLYLHSTMYLLNPLALLGVIVSNIFTFHYVSIKSTTPTKEGDEDEGFTFHYVSIKSIGARNMSGTESQFTFHYVSIKS